MQSIRGQNVFSSNRAKQECACVCVGGKLTTDLNKYIYIQISQSGIQSCLFVCSERESAAVMSPSSQSAAYLLIVDWCKFNQLPRLELCCHLVAQKWHNRKVIVAHNHSVPLHRACLRSHISQASFHPKIFNLIHKQEIQQKTLEINVKETPIKPSGSETKTSQKQGESRIQMDAHFSQTHKIFSMFLNFKLKRCSFRPREDWESSHQPACCTETLWDDPALFSALARSAAFPRDRLASSLIK